MLKTQQVSVPPLPAGWKMFGKYQIKKTDGTPLKGKKYFVLRLDSPNPIEAARVEAAMSAYKGESILGDMSNVFKALMKIAEITKNALFGNEKEVYNIATEALKNPPRNCDVGTLAQQIDRYNLFCGDQEDCMQCPAHDEDTEDLDCQLKWSQLSYNESEQKKESNLKNHLPKLIGI